MKTFFSSRDQDWPPPLTATERLHRTRKKLPNKIQTTKTRNLPVHNHHHTPLYTRDCLIEIVNKTGVKDDTINAFLAQLPHSTQNITYTEFYHFIRVILKTVNGKYRALRKHPVIELLFTQTYLIETFICLRKLSLLDRSNFHAVYLLTEPEKASICNLLDKEYVGSHITQAQINLLKQILPYHQPWLHDTLDILTKKVHPSRSDIINFLSLSVADRKALHSVLVDLFNNHRLTARTYRLAYMKIAKRLDEGILVTLQNMPFDILTALELVQAGGNPHVADSEGDTILHRYTDNIIRNDNPDVCIAALWELTKFCGADINIRNSLGLSPWRRLISMKNPDHIKYALDFLKMGGNCTKVLYPESDNYLDFLRSYRRNDPLAEKMLDILSNKLNDLETSYGINACLRVEPYKIEKLEQIGKGSYGKVYKGHLLQAKIAIKVTKIDYYYSFIDELSAMNQMQDEFSDNVIALKGYDVNVKTGHCYLYMELADRGSLCNLLDNEAPWSLSFRYQLVKDIVNGVRFIHKHQLVHADLKSDNILIDSKGKAKIGDFGLTDKEKNFEAGYGTLLYKAPELLENNPNTFKSDIYSLALIMDEAMSWKFIVTLMHISDSYPNNRLKLDVLAGFRPRIESDCPAKVAELITKGWSHNPEDRPDVEQLAAALPADVEDLSDTMIPGR